MELIKSMAHPNEVIALLKYKFCDATHLHTPRPRSTNLNKCYAFLNATSRSFSAVIQALDDDLRDAICIFYLVLRSLDTIEDDMSIEPGQKVQLLKTFHTNLTDPVWNFTKSQEKDKIVLEEFPVISAEFRALKPVFRKVISEICEKMGSGMSVYLTSSPDTLQQWDEYCHYVAGLVGIGLSEIFSASGLEDASVGKDTWRSNSMGLFLQKTNIIRDYLEDVRQGRLFWPAQVWKKYSSELIDLSRSEKRKDAVHCLNELITNALRHIPDVVEYLSKIENQSVFNFCAIPQVMAIATLERCYNNPRVFTGVVKIRKGEAVHLMQRATNLDNVKAIFAHFVNKIKVRIPAEDPSAFETFDNVVSALPVCSTSHVYISNKQYLPIYVSTALILFALLWHHWTAILASGHL